LKGKKETKRKTFAFKKERLTEDRRAEEYKKRLKKGRKEGGDGKFHKRKKKKKNCSGDNGGNRGQVWVR